MKSPRRWFLLKGVPRIALLALCLGGSSVVKGDSDPLSISVVQPQTFNDSTERAQGYLQVYSATDEFDDGGLVYYSHSSYAIYTIDGELFRIVENHISPGDESPELVALPVGSYVVIARFNRQGTSVFALPSKKASSRCSISTSAKGTDRRLPSHEASRLVGN